MCRQPGAASQAARSPARWAGDVFLKSGRFFMEYENTMTSIQFIAEYTTILEEIDSLIHPDCYPAMQAMYCIDPHDLITPNAYFANREQAFGFAWKLLAAKVKELTNAN